MLSETSGTTPSTALPSVIVFDFFNVFCPEMARGWLTKSGALTPETSEELHRTSVRFDLGQIPIPEFFDEISRFTRVPVAEVESGVRQEEHIDQGVVAIAKKCKEAYRIGLASNANTDWLTAVLEHNHLTELFEHIIISASIGIAKPDERFFIYAAQQFGVSPQEILFIDDKKLNIEAAERVGMQTILFTSAAELERELTSRHILRSSYAHPTSVQENS